MLDQYRNIALNSLPNGLPAIIAFGTNVWSDYWMPRQQYLSRLGQRGWTCAYSAGGTQLWELTSLRSIFAKPLMPQLERTDNVTVYRPGLMIPRWPTWQPLDRLAIRNEVRRMKSVAGPHQDLIFLVSHPSFGTYLDYFGDHPVIYFAEDAHSLIPGWSEEDHLIEEALVRRANLIIACAESMAKELPADGPARARILPNGVDFDAFRAGPSRPCPDDLAAVPHPRIGYTGSINLKVDFKLIAAIARRRPDWNWALVGPVGVGETAGMEAHPDVATSLAACRDLPNVHFLGKKPFHELPAYVGHMDVNTMCYRTDGQGWWKAIDPLKSNEYMAAARPVVSADLKNVRPFANAIDIAGSEDEWIAAIDRALSTDVSQRLAVGQEFARANDWNIKTDQFEQWLLDLSIGAAARPPMGTTPALLPA